MNYTHNLLMFLFCLLSASDVDEYIQANLANINDCQTEIDTLNKNANDEILKVAQKYNQLRQPIYTRRNKHIDLIPFFWSTVVSGRLVHEFSFFISP